ncbi:putative glycoside hydrolase [Haloferula sp.]|uniref:putative glycoside hydrolase n=1 Tax=Haloferula sp. TaxID=2497595 RepID=UPI003C72B380
MRFIVPIIAAAFLKLSASSRAGEERSPAHFPVFSWDKVPVYKMFGDGERLLTEAEAEMIASTSSFLCIEKNHAVKELGGAELGTKREIARFKTLNPESKCLFYFNSAYAYPFTTHTRMFRFGKVEEPYRSFLIPDAKTGELASRGRVHFFDVLNPEFRKWWAETVGECVSETGADGLFVDQMHGFSFLRRPLRAEVNAAQADMMRMAKKAIGRDKILLLNNGAHIAELFDIGDAFMFEHYSPKQLTKEAILADWELMKKISDAGKISVWRIGTEVDEDEIPLKAGIDHERRARERMSYHLAVFLIGAQQNSYFQYGWGWTLKSGALIDFPEFHKPLGAPEGFVVRTDPNGWVFEREYERAHVRVDLLNRKGTIDWR